MLRTMVNRIIAYEQFPAMNYFIFSLSFSVFLYGLSSAMDSHKWNEICHFRIISKFSCFFFPFFVSCNVFMSKSGSNTQYVLSYYKHFNSYPSQRYCCYVIRSEYKSDNFNFSSFPFVYLYFFQVL